MVKAIDRKLLRDLRHLKGQILTVALVVAAGLGGLVGMHSTLSSIEDSMNTYYERQRFGDGFASAVRAPEALERRIETIAGVQSVHTRVVEQVTVPMPGMIEPAYGPVVSVPAEQQPPMNALSIQRGRYLEAGRADEVIVLDSFARAHGLEPGDSLDVVLGGTWHRLQIVGIAMSPEFVFVARRGEFFPEDESIAVLWMSEQAVQAAFGMQGAFNDVVVTLQPGASKPAFVDALDDLLEPYGGLGAYTRDDHPSNSLVSDELEQLRTLGMTIPIGFLAIAAFLLNVVLSRLVQLQRPEIAALKALGYPDRVISAHFFKFVLVILVLGTVLGTAFGAWIGQNMAGQYAGVFRFPDFAFRMDWQLVAIGMFVSLAAGVAGAFGALRRVTGLAPAEAMRPPAPAIYKRTLLERAGLDRILSGSMRIIVREIERNPVRFALSVLGLSLGVALLILGRFGWDAIDRLLEVQFELAAREDVAVVLSRPMPERVGRSLAALPGVHVVEGQRTVAVRFEHEHRYRDSLIIGYPADGQLRHVVDSQGATIELPPNGMVLSEVLAERLALEPGDRISVRVREGARKELEIEVVGVVDDITGLQGYMRLDALNEALGEPPTITELAMSVEARWRTDLFRRLEEMPAVESAQERSRLQRSVRERLDEGFAFQTLMIVLVASAITIGVVYNNARVALSMRGRDLASLRVLGFTRGEVGFILLGEQAIQVLLALPIGWWLGRWFAILLVAGADPEAFRFPVVISFRTYAFASLITIISAALSGLLVRRHLNRMDLTEVLKTRE
ncbi:MAG: ABC transporter permease [Bradymonadaceae bacterium]|nr:ABC transporter permease [Lujinxingiaceae bacterium]